MRKIITITLLLLFLLGLILGSFPNILFGDALSLHYGSTMKVAQDAMAGKTGAWILQCPDMGNCFAFIKAYDNSIGMVGTNIDDIKDMMSISNGTKTGMMTSLETAKVMINGLTEKGWKVVPPTAVPAGLRLLIKTGIAMNMASSTITDLPIVPVAPFMDYPFDTGTIQ